MKYELTEELRNKEEEFEGSGDMTEEPVKEDLSEALDADKSTREINGYIYSLDECGRVIHVEGDLQDTKGERDLSAQLNAGSEYRRETDDGGHFIASRFNGPGEEINLFPQDANFNRGGYKSWESAWGKELSDGSEVHVEIDPIYSGDSSRPNTILAKAEITDKNGVTTTEYYSGANENIRSEEFDIDNIPTDDVYKEEEQWQEN